MSAVFASLTLACAVEDFPEGHGPVATHSAAQPDRRGADAPEAGVEEPLAPPARGLWVLAEGSFRVLDDASRIEDLLVRAEGLGATDLFIQVYRGGRAFYPSAVAPESTYPVTGVAATTMPEEDRPDVLARLIGAARARGLRVHAWVNVLSLSTRRDARMIELLGPEAILVDRRGRSLLDYPGFEIPEPDGTYYRIGTRGLYLDPAVPAVRESLLATFHDLVTRYPDLDGLHLDYIRHPGVLPFVPGSRFGVGLDFGYGEIARARYRAETGRPDPIDGARAGTVRGASHWDAWRRHQVTSLVEEIAAITRKARPGLVLSAAVIPYVDRAYLSLAQDWRSWLESGAIDLAIPMVYTLDDRLLRYQLETFAGWPQRDQIWPGLGVWLFDESPERARAQIATLRDLGFRGEVLFSDDAIASASLLESGLRESDGAAANGAPQPVGRGAQP